MTTEYSLDWIAHIFTSFYINCFKFKTEHFYRLRTKELLRSQCNPWIKLCRKPLKLTESKPYWWKPTNFDSWLQKSSETNLTGIEWIFLKLRKLNEMDKSRKILFTDVRRASEIWFNFTSILFNLNKLPGILSFWLRDLNYFSVFHYLQLFTLFCIDLYSPKNQQLVTFLIFKFLLLLCWHFDSVASALS